MASNSFITSSSKASDQETAVFVEPSFNCCCFQVNPDLGMVAPGSITAMSKEQPPPNKKNLNARKVRKKKKNFSNELQTEPFLQCNFIFKNNKLLL